MNRHFACKLFGLTFGLTIWAGSTMADTQNNNFFLPSIASATTMHVAYRGKPPYRNRARVQAQLRAQQNARLETSNLDRTELSALEISEQDVQTPNSGKGGRKRYGHPYHR